MDGEGDPIEEAWAALEEGRAEETLAILAALDAGDGERWAVEALARVELGDLDEAERALERARKMLGTDDVDVVWAQGEIALHRWRIAEAREAYEAIAELERSVPVLERLALCRDVEGDFETADALLAEANALDPELCPLPPRLSSEEFEAIVQQAVEELPDDFQKAFETTPVIIDAMPGPGAVVGDGRETPPDLLGLFVGASFLERNSPESGELPPAIYLFRRNLERLCRNRDDLKEEIRITLYHELGHALGFDEDGVEEMGLA